MGYQRRGKVAPGRPLAAWRGARGELGGLVARPSLAESGLVPASGLEPEPPALMRVLVPFELHGLVGGVAFGLPSRRRTTCVG